MNNNEYFFTKNHFFPLDLNKPYEESSDPNFSDQNSSETSDYDSDSGSGSGSGSEDSESRLGSEKSRSEESGSGSEESEESESEESESEELIEDFDDLFNSKTNGCEFLGEVIKNRYLILKKLGYGSFSSVWMAYDVELNKLVAIKIINPQDYKEGLLEVKIYKKLDLIDNTYLLTMLDCFEVVPIHSKYDDFKNKKNHIVIVLPLMACSTFDLLKCDKYEDGLPLEICQNIINQTITGIKELEKNGMMHTDLKPENILVCGLNREAEILKQIIDDINIKDVHAEHLSKLLKDGEDIWLISYNLYKKITKQIIQFMKDNPDMKNIKKNMKVCQVSSNYLTDIKIKICDFNLVVNTAEKLNNKDIEIQTRYYRAPEIILGAGLHQKSDYWSIGCVLFELLTGDILFDPEKDKLRSRDIHHLYLIEELAGPIPKILLEKSNKYNEFYDDKGYLQTVHNKIKRWSLANVFIENYDNMGLSDIVCQKVINYITNCLSLNPDNRPNVKSLIFSL
jgi:serine/threonine-protein kinase SRPK3